MPINRILCAIVIVLAASGCAMREGGAPLAMLEGETVAPPSGWTEFCVRFAHSFPQVRATVGATSRRENLREFLAAAQSIEPVPSDIRDEIVRLHYRWSDELDMKAEVWTL